MSIFSETATEAIEKALGMSESTSHRAQPEQNEVKRPTVSEVHKLDKRQTEAELVEGFREELVEALLVQANILDRMQKAGFAGFNHSFAKNHHGNHIIASLVILKAFG